MAGLSSAPRPHYTSHITCRQQVMSVTSITCQCHDHIIIMTPVKSVDKTLAVMSLCFACLLGVVQMFIASETEKKSLVL